VLVELWAPVAGLQPVTPMFNPSPRPLDAWVAWESRVVESGLIALTRARARGKAHERSAWRLASLAADVDTGPAPGVAAAAFCLTMLGFIAFAVCWVSASRESFVVRFRSSAPN
jgi:hypothetical protein